MFMLFFALASAYPSSGQIMAGPAFERFARETDRSCPSRQLRKITPGDLSWEQENYENQISPVLKKRLSAANRGTRLCASRDGMSCPANETLGAMSRTNMLRSFGTFACTHKQP